MIEKSLKMLTFALTVVFAFIFGFQYRKWELDRVMRKKVREINRQDRLTWLKNFNPYMRPADPIPTKVDYTKKTTDVNTNRELNRIVFDDQRTASEVLMSLRNTVERYGFVTLGELYDIVGIISEFKDFERGWKNLVMAKVIPAADNKFIIHFPELEPFPKVMAAQTNTNNVPVVEHETLRKLFFDSRAEAEDIFSKMLDLLLKNGQVSVADYYVMCSEPYSEEDKYMGWKHFLQAPVHRHQNGFSIKLPEPVKLLGGSNA